MIEKNISKENSNPNIIQPDPYHSAVSEINEDKIVPLSVKQQSDIRK